MIRYALKCSNDHSFESWFQSSAAFDSLKSAGMVTCPSCDDTDISKVLMAPGVSTRNAASENTSAPTTVSGSEAPMMSNAPADPKLAEAIRTLRDHVEKNSDYVGDRFAAEARAMHVGDKPHRPIYGEAKPEDAKKLVEDGVPALPLPFIPKQKTN